MKSRLMVCCAAVILVLSLAGGAWAQFAGGRPWQIGDILVCLKHATCNAIRINSDNTVTVLDQFSISSATGDVGGIAIDNSLHAVLADNGNSGSESDAVVVTIASVNPLTGTTLAHTNVDTPIFDQDPNNAQAIAIGKNGHIFIGNSGTGGSSPTIVELNPDGTPAGSFPGGALNSNPLTLPAGCFDTKNLLLSMDLSADGLSLYLTSNGGTIQNLTLATGVCTTFANFGSGVTLYGIKDIPKNALPAKCGSSITNPSVSCPTDEAILVVAIGFTDPEVGEGVEPPASDPDAVNICTDKINDPTPVSCALLIDTNPSPGLTASLWQGGTAYGLNSTILDPFLEIQKVFTAGTSGSQEPTFVETGVKVEDNAVEWTESHPIWHANPPSYSTQNELIIDTNLGDAGDLQKVIQTGVQGPTMPPVFPSNFPAPGQTTDGLVWINQGTWSAGTTYTQGVSTVGDTNQNLWLATIGGISGTMQPPFTSHDVAGSIVYDGAVTWTDRGAWQANTVYPTTTNPSLSTVGDTQFHLWQASPLPGNTTGISGPTAPAFTSNEGSQNLVDGLQWFLATPGPFASPNMYPNWMANTFYCSCMGGTAPFWQNPATNDIWQAATPGTSGMNEPTFYAPDNVTPLTQPIADNAVVWADQGTRQWTLRTAYVSGSVVVDPAGHVQVVAQASDAGRSGATQPSALTNNPWNDSAAPNFGGRTPDGVQWTDKGNYAWKNNTLYSIFVPANPTDPNTVVVDTNGNVEEVKIAGTSTPSSAPAPVESGISNGWNATVGGNTFDNAVIWSDIGKPMWAPATYSSAQVNPPNTKAPQAGTFILDTNGNLEIVTKAGTTGPSQPSAAGNNPWSMNPAVVTIDGLQWFNSSGATSSVVARYPVNGVSTIRGLAVDPFVADCTLVVGGCSTTLSIPVAKVYDVGGQSPSFWLADNGNENIYRLDFATGTQSSPYPANGNNPICGTCAAGNIESIDIYGARGSAQPVLAKLFGPTTTNTAEVFFLEDKLITTIYDTSARSPSFPLTLWASLVDKNSAFTDPGFPPSGVPCQPTAFSSPGVVDSLDCIIWKFDASLPHGDFISTVFGAPSSPIVIDFNTAIFTDMAFNTTTLYGNSDPSDSRFSVHSLHEVTPTTLPGGGAGGGHCTYGSPVPKCFQNGSTIQFKFTCTDLPGSQLGQLSPAPFLLIDQTFPNMTGKAPLECGRTSSCTFSATNGSQNFTYDSVHNQWVFGWAVPPPSSPNTTRYFTGCTTQPQLNPFCTSFVVSPKCSQNPTITSVSPNTGSVGGGTTITITASDFASGATVQIDGAPATIISATSSSIQVTTPSHPAGTANVTVTNPPGPPNGLNGTLINGFTYTTP